jgi:hypothetical protein
MAKNEISFKRQKETLGKIMRTGISVKENVKHNGHVHG